MGRWDADVLIEVEEVAFVPFHTRGLHERVKHFELRRAGGDNDVGVAALANGAPNKLGAARRGCKSRRHFVSPRQDSEFALTRRRRRLFTRRRSSGATPRSICVGHDDVDQRVLSRNENK